MLKQLYGVNGFLVLNKRGCLFWGWCCLCRLSESWMKRILKLLMLL